MIGRGRGRALALALAGIACGAGVDERAAPRSREASVASTTPAPTTPACAAQDRAAWEPAPVGAATFVVNRSTRGMAARVRWQLSPDSSAMLVVEDPVGVENEPVPDGAMYATERTGGTWRMDSVWSVAPSRDWRRLAVGRAVVLGGGEAQQVAPTAWEAPARRLREIAGNAPALRADSLRAHSFAASGMGVVEAAGVTLVIDLDTRSAGPSAFPARFVALDGWRVGFTCDAGTVLVGDRPARSADDDSAAATRRVPVPPTTAASEGAADPVAWVAGPTLDVGLVVDSAAMRPHVVRGRTIRARAGRIVVTERGASGQLVERDVGPGLPLAATRGGRFILALAPRPKAAPYESPDHAVVYRVP